MHQPNRWTAPPGALVARAAMRARNARNREVPSTAAGVAEACFSVSAERRAGLKGRPRAPTDGETAAAVPIRDAGPETDVKPMEPEEPSQRLRRFRIAPNRHREARVH